MTDQRPDDLIDAYLAGELSNEESARVRAYLDAHPGRRGAIAGFRDAARGEDYGPLAHTEAARERFFDQLKRESLRSPRAIASAHHARRWWMGSTGMMSAMVALVVVAGLSYWAAHPRDAQHLPARTYATPVGKRAEFTLRDGTRVILAPRSVLTFQDKVASLVGEAYFQVRPSTTRPLVVRTGNVTTRVIGTTFSVRRYATDPTTRVVVLEGKVQVNSGQSAVLTARGVAHATDSTVVATTTKDPAALTRWTTGELVFQDAPVSEVLRVVERWYGVTFRLADTTLVTDHLTIALDARRNRTETLAALESTLAVRMSVVGDTVTLSPRAGVVRRTVPRNNTIFSPSTGYGR